jgi:hypothetical protein
MELLDICFKSLLLYLVQLADLFFQIFESIPFLVKVFDLYGLLLTHIIIFFSGSTSPSAGEWGLHIWEASYHLIRLFFRLVLRA